MSEMTISAPSRRPQLRRPEPAPPETTTTVPREFVHRRAVAEVFLTGRAARLDDKHFSLTGQWPRAHTLFTVEDGTLHHPLLAAETIRQAGLYLAHSEFGVPLGHAFLLHHLDFTVDREHCRIGSAPTDLTLEATADVHRRGSRRVRLRMSITIRREDRTVATGGGEFTCIPPETYRRMRGGRGTAGIGGLRERPPTVAPHLVGRLDPVNVVLAPTGRPEHWLLSPDPRNPVLFDHSTDHVPGMVLLEAAYQAAHGHFLSHRTGPTSTSAFFHRYVELDEPCTIEVGPATDPDGGSRGVEVTGRQGGDTVFTCVLTAPAAATAPGRPAAA
ncbi:ScbA/BarX family gamma-butyrolactone biosynthesis protein [Streptomyces sp. KL2]|uniref:ScbA/BarX family gamma-butyrolactone biosynthesis protein n=1 Tax=Streptomyces sp. KL2 TaxID=3050126 RepID=UPI00397CC48E